MCLHGCAQPDTYLAYKPHVLLEGTSEVQGNAVPLMSSHSKQSWAVSQPQPYETTASKVIL